jgi:ribonuclease D
MPESDSISGGGKPALPKQTYRHSKFRSANHESAHAEDHQENGPKVQHTLVTHAPPEFVDTQEQLTELLAHLRGSGRFAYDSEFIGELTYYPKLCLIQVATSQRIGLIDPLANLDLNPFWDLLADPSVEKIVHAGQQDVEPVFRNRGKPAANLFDTQIAAGFCALAYPTALSKLVFELVGAKLGKGLTFTHWDQRPLSAMQLKYAADDVRYLIAVHDELTRRITALGHLDWAKNECESLCDPSQYGFNAKSNYLRIRGANALPGKQQAVLQQLTIWRDECARSHNVPPRSFLRDEILLDMARSPIKSVEKLDKVRGLPRPVEEEYGEQIVAVTARGLAMPTDDLPQVREADPSPQLRFRSDALYAAFLCLCSGQSLDPNLVASRGELGEFFRAINSGESVEEHSLMTGWRRQAAGQAMVDLLAGKLKMTIAWDQTLRAVARAEKDPK